VFLSSALRSGGVDAFKSASGKGTQPGTITPAAWFKTTLAPLLFITKSAAAIIIMQTPIMVMMRCLFRFCICHLIGFFCI
jgi:hypothetical protein